MRSIAQQTHEQLGARSSVLVRQRRHHIRLDGLLGEPTLQTDREHQEVDELAAALERGSAADGDRSALISTAPSRPHATVSPRPPGDVLAAVPLSVNDHGRDGLDPVARAGRGPVRTGATALSRAPAGVERSAPVRQGERADTRAGRTTVEVR